MAKKAKTTIKQTFIITYVVPGLIQLMALISGIVLSSFYTKTHDKVFLYADIISVLALSLTYVIVCIVMFFKFNSIYNDGLYKTTALVLRNLKNNVASDISYPITNIKEIDELNKDLTEVNTIISNATMISADLDNAFIPLVFLSEEDRIVTLDSFKNELRSLIYSSQNYRNAIIEIFYDLTEDTLTEEESSRLIKVVKESFVGYKYYLFIPNENNTGYYMFLPRFDSFSHIRERLTAAMKQISLTKKTFDGLTTVNARFSVVAYPYSNINELFPDLIYAKRQGKVINIYLPNRLTALSESIIMQNSLNLNNMSRVLDKLSSLKVTARERDNSYKTIRETLQSLVTYLGIDYAGLILFDDVDNSYYSKISVNGDNIVLFKENTPVDKGLIDAFEKTKDEDNSFYFSSREHAGYILSRYLDRANISGGFYYLVYDHDQVISAVYLFNKNRGLFIDSYIAETMYILSYRIGDFVSITHEEDKLSETYKEINDLLMSSENAVYRINRQTFELVGFSSHFNTFFPKAKFDSGVKCFEALYGLDTQCQNCPLKTSRKMISEILGGKIETSLALNHHKSKLIRLLIHQIKEDGEQGDRFDKDLLINSYYSLKSSLENMYLVHARGYLLLLRIDNHDHLLSEAGSEGYLFLLRNFIRRIKEVRSANANIYSYSMQSIAVLLPEIGQVDLVNFIEKIYDASKEKYQFHGADYSFNVTYLPYSFPQQYPTAEDFLKFTLRHFNGLSYQINQNMICFPDSDYSRSASKNQFMLSVIEEQFGNKTFSVALQPIVKATDKAILGAELLIRLSDNYRNSVFNADELIRVAGQNGKISLISNALIQYIGELYQQYGLTVFKISGFQRLTINTDFSYFDDPNFFQTLFDAFNTYSFQKNFLGFEITEKEIYTHIDEFRKISRGILNHHIVLICDQYSGEYMSMDKLKELGFTEIKIGRYLVGDIEVNPKHLNEITSIDKLAREHDLKITFVGVENSDQYILLRDMDKNCQCQGYHFYRPLDDYKLIEELRKNK